MKRTETLDEAASRWIRQKDANCPGQPRSFYREALDQPARGIEAGISREARVSRISGSGPRESSGVLDLLEKGLLQGLTSPARIRRESREPRGDRKVSTETSARRSSFFRAFLDRGSLETEL